MTHSHGAKVAGYVAIVRQVIAAGEAAGYAIAPVAREGVELAERWLAGEAVSYEAFAAANVANRDEYNRVWSGSWDDRKAWSFNQNVPSAVCNLCAFVPKMVGHESGGAGVVTGVAQALYALEKQPDTKTPLAIRERVMATFEEVAARASPEVAARVPPGQARPRGKPRRVRAADHAPVVGELVAARLERLRARVDPELRGTEEELTRRLRERGYPVYPAVVAFEARWGGTFFPCVFPTNEWDSLLGAYGVLAYDSAECRDGRVPVARGPYDDVYFADAEGKVWAQWIDRPTFAWARDLDRMVARLILCGIAWERASKGKSVTKPGAGGAALARELALPRIAEASDDLGQAWGDTTTLVLEQFGETIVSSTKSAVVRAAR